ncbi:MAG TPA: PfaD family polyunsaturated fatty acid/polyketide biosynthesis protein [Flexilinea sp.]|nr:PfaD family polyunsaturated fatty acid/polyketide biosynthesis protein [Flexilinea sp.]
MTNQSSFIDVSGMADHSLLSQKNMGEYIPLTPEKMKSYLSDLTKPVFVIKNGKDAFLSDSVFLSSSANSWKALAYCFPFTPEMFGDADFKRSYGLKYALYGGAMANAIASEEMVISLGNSGFMGSFGAGGMSLSAIEKAIYRIREALKDKPYAFNLINNPFDSEMEQKTAELYIQNGIHVVEASAYLTINSSLVRYRAAGLKQLPDGSVEIGNKLIAKVSRKEVASQFLQPAPEEILSRLLSEGKLTEEQVRLAKSVPMADDITVEADSGGHTDNRPLVSILPAIIRLRDSFQAKYRFPHPVRIGAAGGISVPDATLAAFMMGAAYVTTGSVNQACIESGASEYTKNLLAQAEITDVAMAPASDMFEMGVKVQVLKRGTMFAKRAQKLYDLYQRYDSVEEIPAAEREKLEATVFKRTLDSVWEECQKFFSERDPKQLEKAAKDPKHKMALIFRWYLGLSSRWSSIGEKGREMDYQIWCGPSLGAFNDWVRGTYLEKPNNRRVADVSLHLLTGAAYLYRIRLLESQGIRFSSDLRDYLPLQPLL